MSHLTSLTLYWFATVVVITTRQCSSWGHSIVLTMTTTGKDSTIDRCFNITL